MTELPRRGWVEAEPGLRDRELQRVGQLAPDLVWAESLSADGRRDLVGWQGPLPAWASDRPTPAGVDELLGSQRLEVQVVCGEAFPVTAPAVFPVSVQVPIEYRTMQAWHVNGDGSLCLIRAAADWQPADSAADLIIKACGWFIEYQLMQRGLIERMTTAGLHATDELDALLSSLATET